MVPQWDLLDLLAEAATPNRPSPCCASTEVTAVVRDPGSVPSGDPSGDPSRDSSGGDRVIGVDHTSPNGTGRLLADLTIACDGRWSVVRRSVGLPVREFPVGFDVWWYRVPTDREVGESLLPRMNKGRVAIAIPRKGYLQVAALGRKGTDAAVRARGVEAFRAETAELLPDLADDVHGIASMDAVKHLDVRLDRLRRWYAPGVLCIGDAAHAMSPMGGVGINLAVQDAVATARILAGPLRRGALRGPRSERILARVQRRRTLPTVLIQGLQRMLHARIIGPALDGRTIQPPQRLITVLERLPVLTAIPAFIVGVGPRPERAPRWARRRTEATTR